MVGGGARGSLFIAYCDFKLVPLQIFLKCQSDLAKDFLEELNLEFCLFDSLIKCNSQLVDKTFSIQVIMEIFVW